MNVSEDVTIKAKIKQNYLEIYSQRRDFQIKERDMS